MVGTTRRGFIAGSVALGAGMSPAFAGDAVPWSAGTEGPKLALPAGATDCHHHIYDRRFPVARGVSSVPADATAADYVGLMRRLGLSRHVVVLPSAYGTDNACLLDALRRFGTATARGVAVVDTGVSDGELKRLDAAGVRGIRFNFAPAGATTPEMIAPLARRIAPLGWHVQLNAVADQVVAMGAMLSDLPCPLVLDHLAHVPEPAGTSHAVYALAERLLGEGKAWVKLSAVYADTRVGPPGYGDSGAVVRAYVAAAPERLVWGTDWPHPSEPANGKPDDAHLVDLLSGWVPEDAVRRRILVDNPAKLYGF